MRCGSLTHSGLVESSRESQWELLSLVDNTQRGSQQRMINKLHHTAEIYHQTGESEMTRMERGRLERERERAREEKREIEDRARQAEMRVRELEREQQRVREVERERDRERARAHELQQRLEEVERREHEKSVV